VKEPESGGPSQIMLYLLLNRQHRGRPRE
jgi:hypothetical protein